MNVLHLKTDQLIPYANNLHHNEDAVDVIITGHTRRLAAIKLGLESAPCIIADHLTPAQVQVFRLADKRVAEVSAWDNEPLPSNLDAIKYLRETTKKSSHAKRLNPPSPHGEITMATVRPKRPCAHPGCQAWAMPCGSYCEKHQAEWESRQEAEKASRQEARREAEKTRDRRRGTAAQRGYNSAWVRARKAYIIRHPLCAACGAPATDVDHIRPHKGNKKIFWDSTNWQPLCHSCHAKKTYEENAERFRFGKKKKQEGVDDKAMGIYFIP